MAAKRSATRDRRQRSVAQLQVAHRINSSRMDAPDPVVAEDDARNTPIRTEYIAPVRGSICDRLLSTKEVHEYAAVFCNNLPLVFEYDKTDIIEFLLDGNRASDQSHKDKLLALRLQILYETLCTSFPEYQNCEMHNRRKSDLVSEDIYTIGYSVVNQLKYRRLSTVLKQGGATNTIDNSNDVSMNVVDSNSLLETCVTLKDSVTDLTIAVSSLTGELTTLREKVALLEMRLYDGGPAAQQVDWVRATTAETHEKSTNYTYTVTDPDEPAAKQADPVIDTIPETQELSTNNAVTVPTSLSSSQRSYADVASHATTCDVTSAFRLSGQQRRRTRRGGGRNTSF